MPSIVVTGKLMRAIRNVPMDGVLVRAMNTAAFGVGEIAYLIETAPPMKVDEGDINGEDGFTLTVPAAASNDTASYAFGLPRDNETLDTVTLALDDSTDPLTLEEAITGGTPGTGGTINISGKIYLPFSGLPYPTGAVQVQLVERFITDDGIFLAVSEDIKIDNGDFNGASGLTLYVPDGQSEWLFTFPDGTQKTAMLGTHTSMVEIADIANGDYATELDPMNVPTSFNTVQDGVDVDLTWNDTNSDETGYRIERSDDSGATWDAVTVTSAGATSYTDTAPDPDDYIYRIRAEKSGGQSAWVTDTITVSLATPSGFALSYAGADFEEIELNWTSNAAGATYEIEYSTNGSSWAAVDETAADAETYTFTDSDYDIDVVTHHARIRASLGGSFSAWVTDTISGLWVRTPHGYLLDEAVSGGTRVDAIGSHDLTDNSNNTNYTTGIIGNAARFTASGWLQNTALTTVEDFAITGWVRFPSDTTGGFLTFGHPSNNCPVRSVRDSGNIWVVDRFFGDLNVSGLTHGAWHFIYVGYDMSTRTLYASIDNGTQVSSTRTVGANDYPNASFTPKFLLGVADGLSGNTVDMDNFYIRNRIPSAAQLTAEYNSGNGVAYPN